MSLTNNKVEETSQECAKNASVLKIENFESKNKKDSI